MPAVTDKPQRAPRRIPTWMSDAEKMFDKVLDRDTIADPGELSNAMFEYGELEHTERDYYLAQLLFLQLRASATNASLLLDVLKVARDIRKELADVNGNLDDYLADADGDQGPDDDEDEDAGGEGGDDAAGGSEPAPRARADAVPPPAPADPPKRKPAAKPDRRPKAAGRGAQGEPPNGAAHGKGGKGVVIDAEIVEPVAE